MFCGLVIIIKILIPSTAGGLGRPFWFHILFSMAFLDSWLQLFLHHDCFGLDFISFLVFLPKFCLVMTWYGVLANVAVHQDTVVCQRPKKQKKTCSTQVCYLKLLNSAFRISKTIKLIFTKLIYFLPYIHTTSHIKIVGNRFSTSWDICS